MTQDTRLDTPPGQRCQCCGGATLPHDALFEICDVCGWQNDPAYGNGWPTNQVAGPNRIPLDDARVNFRRHGSMYPVVDLDRIDTA